MIGRVIGLSRCTLLRQTNCMFSKITPQQIYPEQSIQLIDFQSIIQKQRRNVMKNYDLFLPGVYIRNQFAMEQQLWETKSKRHRHAKLKRNRRKGPRRTTITNN